MPVSKNGALYYTTEQYEQARYRSSALDYALSQGYPLEKKGNEYKHKEHNSMVFTQNGAWFWNSRQMRGGAIEFITQYEHKSLVEAVLILAGERVNAVSFLPNLEKPIKAEAEDASKVSFTLPPHADSKSRMYAYLSKERKLDLDIVNMLIGQKKIYQSDKNNVVFVSYDNVGNPKAGIQRGTLSAAYIREGQEPFKGDVKNSDKSYPFHIVGKDTNTVAVFESPIDAISHASLEKAVSKDWQNIHRITLSGLADHSLERFLEEHKEINKIIFCLDNDMNGTFKKFVNGKEEILPRNHGQVAANQYAVKYTDLGYVVEIQTPINKDFNEDLKQYRTEQEEQSVAPEAVQKPSENLDEER